VKIALSPGAEPEGGARELRFAGGTAPDTKRLRVRPGIELAPVQEPLTLGDSSTRLRVLATSFDGRRYVARLQGLRNRTYRLRLRVPFQIESIDGGDVAGRDGEWTNLAVSFAGDRDWIAKDLVVLVGRRRSD
jgi:hypothetical protein